MATNIFSSIPEQLPDELCESLLNAKALRIERIVSKGHSSPADFWYDQTENEWILLLQGAAQLGFADQSTIDLTPGDYLLIKAHCLHKVLWTVPDTETIWLAIHFNDD